MLVINQIHNISILILLSQTQNTLAKTQNISSLPTTRWTGLMSLRKSSAATGLTASNQIGLAKIKTFGISRLLKDFS